MFSASKTGAGASGYPIVNSLRFQSASSQYATRTPASAGNRKTWTWSGWVKRGSLTDANQAFWSAGSSGTSYQMIRFNADGTFEYHDYVGGYNFRFTSTQVFRDPSAWYHVVIVMDTTQATSTNRVKIYFNNVQVTAFSTATYPALNLDGQINSNIQHMLGYSLGGQGYFDGYMAEVNFIDGQALTPSSFGSTDATTGQWIAKSYSGSYGTNGFFLKFANGTSTTTLGTDSSGNGNNWTLNNFTRSAGVSDCWMYDVPSGNGGVAGTQPNSNYCVLNPLYASIAPSGANLNFITASAAWQSTSSTIFVTSGKWYWEGTVVGAINFHMIGIATNSENKSTTYAGASAESWTYLDTNGEKYGNGANTAYGATYTAGDVIAVALDMDAGTLTFYKNNTSQGVAFSTNLTGKTLSAWFGSYGASKGWNANFGQRSFAYTPPSGFKALCTANLPASTIVKGNQYMDATLYTGTGSARSVTNAAGFQPDLVWMKGRSVAHNNCLSDVVRGLPSTLFSNNTNAEDTNATLLTAFNSNGFTLGNNSTVNENGTTYVAWQWDAGSSTVTNTSGSITSTVSVNTTAGFSIVTYTGNGGTNATVGHGLGVAPQVILAKVRSTSADWECYFASVGATKVLHINTNQAPQTLGHWGNTSPTSSVFTVNASGTGSEINGNGSTYVAYCFAEIAGFSKFGSYTGNGSADGTFVYTGFLPKYVMIKRTNTTGNWYIFDTARNTYNAASNILEPNLSDAEYSYPQLDIVSNGLKFRGTDSGWNASGGTYIYMAFAESPFSSSNAR